MLTLSNFTQWSHVLGTTGELTPVLPMLTADAGTGELTPHCHVEPPNVESSEFAADHAADPTVR